MTEQQIKIAYEAIKQYVQTHVTGGANPKLALWAQDNFGPAQKRASTLERVARGLRLVKAQKNYISQIKKGN